MRTALTSWCVIAGGTCLAWSWPVRASPGTDAVGLGVGEAQAFEGGEGFAVEGGGVEVPGDAERAEANARRARASRSLPSASSLCAACHSVPGGLMPHRSGRSVAR
jgi:cytochrome c553